MRTINFFFFEDIWTQSREDVMNVFGSLLMVYYNNSDQNAGSQYDTYLPTNMTEKKMMIETRPRYPSNKLTFSIANIAKGKTIPYIILNLNAKLDADIDVILEDSKRNFLNSLLFCFVF